MSNYYQLTDRHKAIITVIFFMGILFIGLISYADYGISWDELRQRTHGVVALGYIRNSVIPSILSLEILEGFPAYPEYRYQGYVLFHLPILLIEEALGLNPERAELWKTRHIYTFLWFFVGLIFLYKIVLRNYGWLLGLLGCLFMVLSPRIFAHSFYNVKDLVFLSTVLVALYFSLRYLERKDLISALLLALSIAIATNIRIIGLMFLALVIFFTVTDWFKSICNQNHIQGSTYIKLIIIAPLLTTLLFLLSIAVTTYVGFIGFIFLVLVFSFSSKSWINNIRVTKNIESASFAVLLFLTPLLTILFWPGAWINPLNRILNSLIGQADFIGWPFTVLYMGDYMLGKEVPWHYIPVWLSITTPVIYLVLFIVGFVLIVKTAYKCRFQLYTNNEEKESLFCLLALAIPVVTAIVLSSTLYDGWRHQFFIYAPLLLISIKGFYYLITNYKLHNIKSKIYKPLYFLIFILFGLNLVYIAYWMATNHPYQNVYFNALAGNRVEYTFERDYWGLSAREGLEYIVKNDDRELIKIHDELGHIKRNLLMLDSEDQRRLLIVEKEEAEYIVENYRRLVVEKDETREFIDSYRKKNGQYLGDKEVFSLEVDGITIMSVFDLRADKAQKNIIEQ